VKLATQFHVVPGLCGAISPLLQYAYTAWCSVKAAAVAVAVAAAVVVVVVVVAAAAAF